MLKKIWKHLRSDWIRVLMALALAMLVYVSRSDIFSNQTEIRELSNIPVKLEFPNSNIINLNDKENTVSVTFEGSPQRISKLSAEQISISVDITQSNLQSGLVEITEKNIKHPLGIRIKEINTPRITVNLETIESKKVPVRITFDSLHKLSENYTVSKTAVFPQEVMISGPKSKIDDVKEVLSSPIPLDSSIQDNFKYTADIVPAAGITTVPSKVECEIYITRTFGKRTLKKIPVSILEAPHKDLNFSYKLNPAEVEIEISGPSRIVHFLTANDFDVFVNAKNITKSGEYILNIRCNSRSPEVKIISITPLQLTLTAEQKK